MSDSRPDVSLLAQLDESEWSRVQARYAGRLLAFARRRVGDEGLAEDIVQETFLGAVRGIGDFDARFTFEQFLFGICRNRSIDLLRRQRVRGRGEAEGEEDPIQIDRLATTSETPSGIVRAAELSDGARSLLILALADWADEAWEQGEGQRLSVIEALFVAGWRNKQVFEHFGLRDQTAVAGIKFRALRRLGQLAAARAAGSDLLLWIAGHESEGRLLDMDVGAAWRDGRISCPARHWLARSLEGNLAEELLGFVDFHLEEMECPWCNANRDDLRREAESEDLDPLLARVKASTAALLDKPSG